jgi:hypothetical protein
MTSTLAYHAAVAKKVLEFCSRKGMKLFSLYHESFGKLRNSDYPWQVF